MDDGNPAVLSVHDGDLHVDEKHPVEIILPGTSTEDSLPPSSVVTESAGIGHGSPNEGPNEGPIRAVVTESVGVGRSSTDEGPIRAEPLSLQDQQRLRFFEVPSRRVSLPRHT